MSTEYSNYGDPVSVPSISPVSSYKAYIKATITDYPTYVSVALEGNCLFANFTGGTGSTSTLDGTSITDGNTYCTDTTGGNGWAVAGHGAGTKSFNINKGAAAQSVSYTCSQNIMYQGTSSATVTINVPALAQYTVAVISTTGGGSGKVDGETSKTVYHGTQVTFTATPSTGYSFIGWYFEGVAYSQDNPLRNVTIGGNVTLDARFAVNTYTAAAVSGGNGTATVNGQSSVTVNYGTNVTYAATPSTGYHFVKWSDNNTNATRTVTITGDTTLTATFAINTFTATAASNGNGTATVNGQSSVTVNYGTNVTYVATPSTGYHFVKWSDNNTNATRTVTVTENISLIATFAINSLTATAASNGNGTATVNGQSSVSVNYGTNVTYVATPNAHYAFSSWSDGDINATRTVQVTSNITLTATFAKKEGEIGVKADGDWKQGTAYVKVSGEWKVGTVYIKRNGTWQLTKGV